MLDNKEESHFFNAEIAGSFNEEIVKTECAKPNLESWDEIIGDDPEFEDKFKIFVNDKDVPEADDNYDPDIYRDTYMNMQLAINQGEYGQSKDAEGRPVGVSIDNKILDTWIYKVKYADGYKTIFADNTIPDNLFVQVDAKYN